VTCKLFVDTTVDSCFGAFVHFALASVDCVIWAPHQAIHVEAMIVVDAELYGLVFVEVAAVLVEVNTRAVVVTDPIRLPVKKKE
jgi:hypothetical protein